ncbi:MAG TPA: hypothetical protein VGG36_13050, partial [Rhizomicrobium sp.]
TSPRKPITTSGIPRRRGAQPGNTQALKHGRHSKASRALRARIHAFRKRVRLTLAGVESQIEARNKESAKHAPRGPRKWLRKKR